MQEIKLIRPESGQKIVISDIVDARLIVSFSTDQSTIEHPEGSDSLFFKFDDGASIELKNFYTVYNADTNLDFEVEGQSIAAEDFFQALGSDIESAAGSSMLFTEWEHQPLSGRFRDLPTLDLDEGLGRLESVDGSAIAVSVEDLPNSETTEPPVQSAVPENTDTESEIVNDSYVDEEAKKSGSDAEDDTFFEADGTDILLSTQNMDTAQSESENKILASDDLTMFIDGNEDLNLASNQQSLDDLLPSPVDSSKVEAETAEDLSITAIEGTLENAGVSILETDATPHEESGGDIVQMHEVYSVLHPDMENPIDIEVAVAKSTIESSTM